MEKTQQIILTSSHERIEFSLWTLGLPYRVSTLNEILEFDVVKLSINVFICFSSDEEETLLERDNQCLIFRVFDIFKIWPATYFDKKVTHGSGTILDDIISGVFAGIVILIGKYFLDS